MKTMKKALSLFLMLCLLLGMSAVTVSSAGDAAITAALQGNTGAVITASEPIQSVKADESLVSVSVTGNTATLTALTGDAVLLAVTVTTDSSSQAFEIPLGYTTFYFNGDTLTVYEGSDTKYEVEGINLADETYAEGDEAYPLSVSADEDGNPVYTNTDAYTINVGIKKKGGTYVFYGQSDDMTIKVNKEATDPATLILAGLDLTSSFTSPVTVNKNSASTVEIYNPAGFSNTLTDCELNNEDTHGAEGTVDTLNPEYSESAVIKGKDYANITICGSGSLKLNCNSKNAVKVNDYGYLTIKDVDLTVNSVDHGLSSDNELTVESGTIDITCAGDGIRSDPDTVDAALGLAGKITVNGGDITIAAGSDGIQANELLTITGGTFNITTGDGYNDSDFDSETESCKGLKASVNTDDTDDTAESTCTIEISGGTFNLNCADDAVHSDGYILITGGKFEIQTGDDGVHADTSLTVGTEGAALGQPKITVETCYEGLEAGNVYIYDGDISITASDDGINAAGGSDSSDTNTGFNPGGQPGRPGQNTGGTATTSNYSINIYGGEIFVNTNSDGFDSNGALNLLGGEIIVWGASSGDGEPLDHDGTLTINGATVLAAGNAPMGGGGNSSSGSSGQTTITYTRSVQSGKTINVKNGDTTVFNTKAVKSCSYVLYSSPDTASSWSIVIDDSELIEEEISENVEAFESLVAALGEITSLEQADEVAAARAAYESLTDEEKKQVSAETLEILTAAEERIAKLEELASILPGDVNGDGKVNVVDIMRLKKLIANGGWTDAEFAAGDLDESGELDVLDIAGIKTIILSA